MTNQAEIPRHIYGCAQCVHFKNCPKYYENENRRMVRCSEFKENKHGNNGKA